MADQLLNNGEDENPGEDEQRGEIVSLPDGDDLGVDIVTGKQIGRAHV